MKNKSLQIAAAAFVAFAPTLAFAQSGARLDAFFQKADANHDGILSLAEWKAAGRKEAGFHRIDANNDGKLTPDELKAAMAAAMAARGHGG